MTAYEKGLEKLGLHPRRRWIADSLTVPDLRTDPAFAWRVLEALYRFDYGTFLERWATKLCGDLVDEPLADALYTTVCELGKEKAG